ncbi:MAG: translocation/assembly module TamB domain-containing protein [Gammaproteobacteria bacterium]
MTMKPRLLKIATVTLVVLMIVLVAVLTAFSAVLGTNTGSAWLLDKALAQTRSETRSLSIGSSLGTLLSGMDINALYYRDDNLDLRIDSVRARWNPMSILGGDIRLDRVSLQGLELQWLGGASTSSPTQGTPDPFSGIPVLPWPVSIGSLSLDEAYIGWTDGNYSIDSLSLSARLRERELQVDALRYAAGPASVQGELKAQLQAAMPLQGQLQWQYRAALAAGLENASGELEVGGDLNTLHIAHRLQQPLQLQSEGDVELQLLAPGSTPIAFRLNHTLPAQLLPGVSLPDAGQLRLASAALHTQGNVDAIQVDGEAQLHVEQSNGETLLPPLHLQWQGLVQSESLRIDTLSVDTDSGHADATGNVQWQDGLALSLHLRLNEEHGEDYAVLLPAGLHPGSLAGEADVSWQRSNAGDQLQLRIASLNGELNTYPLSAQGALRYGGSTLHIEDLQLASGSTRLAINGNWDDSVDLDWRVQASNLGTLSPLLSGSLEASGRIQGTPETPQISLSANGSNIDLAGIQIHELRANGAYLNNSNQLRLELEQLNFGADSTQQIDSLTLDASGLPAAHELQLALSSPHGSAQLTFTGALDYDNAVPWSGNLRSGTLLSDLGEWQLGAASALQLSSSSAQLARQCWLQGPSTLCLEAGWQQDSGLRANANLNTYPLTQFNAPLPGETTDGSSALLPRLPPRTRAAGNLNARVTLEGDPAKPDTLSLQFQLDAGEGRLDIQSATPDDSDAAGTEPEGQSLYWRSALVEGSRHEGQWQLISSLDFYQPDLEASGRSVQGTADARLNIRTDESLDGQINLAFQDLSWVEAFVPVLQNPRGQLRGLSLISGTLAQPHIGGSINLTDAAVDIPAAGISLHDISMSLSSDSEQTVVIQGRASSGEGTLSILSELTDPLSPARRLDMSLNGENFTLASNEQIHLTLSPNLQIRGDASALDVRGSLTLPVLDVQINTLPESAVDVSPDTVLINTDANDSPVRNAAQVDRGMLDALALTAELHLALGDEARFRGFGLDARLNGGLDITQRETGAPLTYGELTVLEGNYQTYGRTLNIEHGKLLFFGAMDNPALDIRAVRQAENVKVGVQMNGTLRNIRSQLFSTPTLPDGDIIAVMLTGRPLAEVGNQDSNALIGAITNLGINQGQSLTNQVRNQLGLDTLAITSTGDTSNSSLTLGKYLTPKLFIRYGVGLFETESTLAVDYSVSDRIKLEAKSGSTQSVDIKYTVER